ncbi:hypothetical protein [Gemmobacter sp.]|uniref:hypothetical protein n=1 Tax=Gemmobacter sp. TaxID=1898957 RepID=UPI002AFFB6DC|nr:hypothetical protein [Gemmobacter sp.]
MRAALILMLVGAVATTAACARRTTVEASLPYRAALKAQNDGLLLVSVKAPGATVDMVRESVRYRVTTYCLTNRGSSVADWETDAATGDWAYTADTAGEMTFRARCRA